MTKYYIHRSSLKKLTDMANSGGGYQKVEILGVMKDFEVVVPDPEQREQWVQIKFMVYGG